VCHSISIFLGDWSRDNLRHLCLHDL
jgi:hypothetical protein